MKGRQRWRRVGESEGARGRGDGDRGAESSLEIYGRLLWSSD